MIRPLNITADSLPGGGAIRLDWINPVLSGFKGTQVLRAERDFPSIASDVRNNQNIVFDDSATPLGSPGSFTDSGLKPEAVYYYAVVAYDSSFQPYPALISAMTTAPYQTAAYLYSNLPGVYQAYDTAQPPPSPALDPADAKKGQLLRFLEMLGPQFDLLRSYSSGMRTFFDRDRIDGTLLPLLAQWIGWQTNYTLGVAKQRNELKFAPQYYATTGVAASLQATLNRVVDWDAQLKEFAHNVFLSNRPEELKIHEQRKTGAQWQPSAAVSLDIAYEGKASVMQTLDGRALLFHHARQRGPGNTPDRWHIWYKVWDRSEWMPAHLTSGGDFLIEKSPAALQRSDGSIWLFSSVLDPAVAAPQPHLLLRQMSVGRRALNARAVGSVAGPFAFADGEEFQITVGSITRTVTIRAEQFAQLSQATAAETAALLDRELPGVTVTAVEDGTIVFSDDASGAASSLVFPVSSVGTKLGVPVVASVGADAVAAQLTGTLTEPFSPAAGDTLVIALDGDVPRTIQLSAADTTAARVAAAINAALPGIATAAAGRVDIASQNPGERSLVSMDINRSTAAPKLGFGAPIPPSLNGADDTEPSAFEDASGNVWLFWSSLRDGSWTIWYSRFDGLVWGTPKPLTTGALPDREPFVLFDPSAGGRIWVFWTRRKTSGLRNIFFRTTAKLNFAALVDGDWTESELTPVPSNYDNREPAAIVSSAGNIDLFFASSRANGWNVWEKSITTAAQGPDTSATTGQFTQRAPSPLLNAPGALRLFFRSNETVVYPSSLYPSSTTIDARYGGSSTADTRNTAQLSMRGTYSDISRYTDETPKASPLEEEKRVYSRDTVGVFLTPDTADQQLILRNQATLASEIKRFLPIQVRAVLLIQAYREYVYAYDQRGAAAPPVIEEQFADNIFRQAMGPLEKPRTQVNLDLIRTLATYRPFAGSLPNFILQPPDLSSRLPLFGANEVPE